jgi:hypothetical protein
VSRRAPADLPRSGPVRRFPAVTSMSQSGMSRWHCRMRKHDLRRFALLFHSSIDEPFALSHRVGIPAAPLIGCIPRPIRTALTMSSDSSSRMNVLLPAVAGA